MITDLKKFPEGMQPLADSTFTFACNPEVPCFTRCCRKLTLFLYPYDLIRLKKRLGINSEELLHNYTGITQGSNPLFPGVVMRMKDEVEGFCPFLDQQQGCLVYEDRPGACRTYPLERAVDRKPTRGQCRAYYFMTEHSYCLGHQEEKEWTVKEWLRDQQLAYYNAMEDRWAEMDSLFASNPWQGEGAAGPRQQLAFMVCYNLDRFRQYVIEHNLLNAYRLDKARKRLIETDDEALLTFGYDWLQLVLGNRPTLQLK